MVNRTFENLQRLALKYEGSVICIKDFKAIENQDIGVIISTIPGNAEFEIP